MPEATASATREGRYAALLEIVEAVAASRRLDELTDELGRRLQPFLGQEFVFLALHDPPAEAMRLVYLGHRAPLPEPEQFEAMPISRSAAAEVARTQEPLLVADTETETRFPEGVAALRARGIRSTMLCPLTTPRRRLGAIGFASAHPLSEDQGAELFQRIANIIAVAVENALNHEAAQRLERALAAERDRLRVLLDVNQAVIRHLDLVKLLATASGPFRRAVEYDWASVALFDAEAKGLRLHALDDGRAARPVPEGVIAPLGGSPGAEAFATKRPKVTATVAELEAYDSDFARSLIAAGVKSQCCAPLLAQGEPVGTLNVSANRENAFTAADVDCIAQVANQIAPAVANALAYREIERLKDLLAEEKLVLEEDIKAEFAEIVGESPALKRVLGEVETVATTDSTVLVWGETGTGKELIARAIHRLSRRGERNFVKINCAAIPTGLLESELFGHEKGAFTGAVGQKIGRFELAHRGTLFLDEVGDIPAELQPKLLRVLQEQEFERLGSTKTIKVDVRLVAATNRDLAAMVAERTFRSDLYYRLNVFPVTLPSLRERPEDIPLLVRHFVGRCARRMSKKIDTIPTEAMDALTRYAWPGNIRELENIIERAVILTRGSSLHVEVPRLSPLAAPAPAVAASASVPVPVPVPVPGAPAPAPGLGPAPVPVPVAPGRPLTLRESEQAAIIEALRATNWVVSGPSGAAARLGLSRTTLQAKMEKLGISRPV